MVTLQTSERGRVAVVSSPVLELTSLNSSMCGAGCDFLSLSFYFCKVSTVVAEGPEPTPPSPLEGEPLWLVWLYKSSGTVASATGPRRLQKTPRPSSHPSPPLPALLPELWPLFSLLYTPLGPHKYLPTANDSEILHGYTFPVEYNRKGVSERREFKFPWTCCLFSFRH